MTAPVVRRIGRYRLEEVIGAGGFAVVHRAVDERLGDTVAVKVLADNHCLDPDMRERFIAEGRVLRRIDSPHVVRVHDMGETDQQQLYLVLEYADRGTLAARVVDLRAGGWTPGRNDLRVVARSLAAALEAVHRADLVHRDLSPRNMLLRSTLAPRDDPQSAVVAPDERLLLADLGLCKDLALHSGVTVSGGTEGFRPPEQSGGPSRVDARADLWALSALLVWLVTGHPPGDRPVRAALTAAGLPRRFGEVLTTSLAEDPRKRHANVAAWLTDVESALLPPTQPPRPQVATTRRSPWSVARTAVVPRDAEVAAKAGAGDAVGQGGRATDGRLRFAAGIIVGLLLGSGVLLASDLGLRDPGPAVTQLGDGRVQSAREDGDARVAIIGPAEVTVGDVATFEADTRDVEDWVWLLPDRSVRTGEPQVQLRTRSRGIARITLLGVSSGGDRVEVVHDLRVVGG
jgi:eukaryotic-like serine/threonine-protein kinase